MALTSSHCKVIEEHQQAIVTKPLAVMSAPATINHMQAQSGSLSEFESVAIFFCEIAASAAAFLIQFIRKNPMFLQVRIIFSQTKKTEARNATRQAPSTRHPRWAVIVVVLTVFLTTWPRSRCLKYKILFISFHAFSLWCGAVICHCEVPQQGTLLPRLVAFFLVSSFTVLGAGTLGSRVIAPQNFFCASLC